MSGLVNFWPTFPKEKRNFFVNSSPASVAPSCVCEICQRFNDDDTSPLMKYLGTCDNCSKVWTDDEPLKPCSCCLFRAYCSKDCQKSAWRSHHKAIRDPEIGEEALGLRRGWMAARQCGKSTSLSHMNPALPPRQYYGPVLDPQCWMDRCL